MSNSIKFTDEEINEIRMLQGKFQEKVFEFGRFRLERMHLLRLVKELEDREAIAEEEYGKLQTMETQLLEKLTSKYGEGSLNIQDGVFTPVGPVTENSATP